MFERFTLDARKIVVNSQEHSRRLGHHYIGCEHLLLSVASLEDEVGQVVRAAGATPEAVEATIRRLVGGGLFEGVDREALAAIGVDLDAVRESVEAHFGTQCTPAPRRRRRWGRRRRRTCRTGTAGHIPFTPRAKKCLELSLREALAAKDRHVGTEHVALALIRMNDSLAGQVFAELRIAPAALRTDIKNRHRRAG